MFKIQLSNLIYASDFQGDSLGQLMPFVQSWLHLLPLDFKHTKNLFIKILLKSPEPTIIFPTSIPPATTYSLFFNFSMLYCYRTV